MNDALLVSNIALWIVVLALVLGIVALARQIGILYERVAPMGALMIDTGPKPGELAPLFELPGLTGGSVALGGVQEKSTLLFFVSPTCPVCKKLLPVVKGIARDESSWLRVVLASDGEQPEHLAFYQKADLAAFPYVLSQDLGMAYRIAKLPYAVLISEAGQVVAKGLVNSREQMESLFTARDLAVASVQEFIEHREQRA